MLGKSKKSEHGEKKEEKRSNHEFHPGSLFMVHFPSIFKGWLAYGLENIKLNALGRQTPGRQNLYQ